MTARFFFEPFEGAIRERFAAAVAEAGDCARHLTLELRDEPHEVQQWRTEFSVTMPNGPVRITWAAIASLWCCSQGAARLARRMFEGKRNGSQRLYLADDPEIPIGLNLLELSRRLYRLDLRVPTTGESRWVDWAPMPELAPANEDSRLGNTLFFGALGWIMRHEIAHVTLGHVVGIASMQAENEADRQATQWYRGDRQADAGREPGARPARSEIELEFRAVAMGFGLMWVAMFEVLAGRAGTTHPPTAERIYRCMEQLELREDSLAAEVLGDTLQVWLDPQGNWAPPGGYANAQAALDEALDRLYRSFDPRGGDGEADRNAPALRHM